jgi:hypothetical protein
MHKRNGWLALVGTTLSSKNRVGSLPTVATFARRAIVLLVAVMVGVAATPAPNASSGGGSSGYCYGSNEFPGGDAVYDFPATCTTLTSWDSEVPAIGIESDDIHQYETAQSGYFTDVQTLCWVFYGPQRAGFVGYSFNGCTVGPDARAYLTIRYYMECQNGTSNCNWHDEPRTCVENPKYASEGPFCSGGLDLLNEDDVVINFPDAGNMGSLPDPVLADFSLSPYSGGMCLVTEASSGPATIAHTWTIVAPNSAEYPIGTYYGNGSFSVSPLSGYTLRLDLYSSGSGGTDSISLPMTC